MRLVSRLSAVAAISLLAAGCGGSSPVASNAGAPRTPPTSSPAPASMSAPPETGAPGADILGRVRFVDLYVAKGGAAPSLAVYVGEGDPQPGDTPALTLGFEQTSEYITLQGRQHATVQLLDQAPGSASDFSTELVDLGKGDQVTVVLYPAKSAYGFRIASFHVWEAGPQVRERWGGEPVPGKALTMIMPAALEALLPQDLSGMYYISVGKGCLKNHSPRAQDFGFGGNVPEFFDFDPGVTQVAYATNCTGATPIIAATRVQAQAGQYVALFPYGSSTTTLKLFVLQVPVSP